MGWKFKSRLLKNIENHEYLQANYFLALKILKYLSYHKYKRNKAFQVVKYICLHNLK
jgi:hypothetical protein